jgi:1,4-dihydroxy-2-naphthoyl-CoA synthase
MKFEDILYEAHEGVATITINRPESRNAVRPQTYEELTAAMAMAGRDTTVGVVLCGRRCEGPEGAQPIDTTRTHEAGA